MSFIWKFLIVILILLSHFGVDYGEYISTQCAPLEYPYILQNLDKCWEFDEASSKHNRLPMIQNTPHKERFILKSLPVDRSHRNFPREVRGAVFSVSAITPLKMPVVLAATSQGTLDLLDLDASRDADYLERVTCGVELFQSYKPISHCYGGHQFGYWSGQLGDGRAHIIGEYVTKHSHRWELQLKGSGITPYSRHGDGRAVLRSSVREFLASEAMHHLGIPTSRAAALVIGSDDIVRDQFYNGNFQAEKSAIVLRLAPSWFRFGSFEIHARRKDYKVLKELADFTIKHHFSHINMDSDFRYLEWYSDVVNATAYMIALWQSVGFTHGVCNTDNFSILSQTIDYGPYGFMDEFQRDYVPNTSDDERRYSYEKQPEVAFFNLDKLREALLELIPPEQQTSLMYILMGYRQLYQQYYSQLFKNKLGLLQDHNELQEAIELLLDTMEDTSSDFTITFRQLSKWSTADIQECSIKHEHWALKQLSSHEKFTKFCDLYRTMISREQSDNNDALRAELMNKYNAKYVLRNWMAEIAIREAASGKYKTLNKIAEILSHPFTEQPDAESAGYASIPPKWAQDLKVSCSS